MLGRISFLLLISHSILTDSRSSNLGRIGTKPTSSPLNEISSDCVEYCLPTCEKPKQPPCIYNTCQGGCLCKEGYIRLKEGGKCVAIESCVDPAEIIWIYTAPCKENEEITECLACEGTCALIDNPVQCLLLWCPKGCICKPGFIRREEGGDCISESECRRSRT